MTVEEKETKQNFEVYPVLNTTLDVESWWNSLDWKGRVDVGGLAVTYTLMTANYRWNTGSNYSDLKKSQRAKVNYIFNRRNDMWTMFPKGSVGINFFGDYYKPTNLTNPKLNG